MAKEKKVVMNPPAELDPRPGDVPLSLAEYLQISLFKRLKAPPSLEKFPGAFKLRRFQKGEVICRQGAAGWTAFYLLTGADLVALKSELLAALEDEGERSALEAEVAALPPVPAQPRHAVTVHITLARPAPPRPPGLLGWLLGGKRQKAAPPKFIPVDAPRDVDYDSKQVALHDGDLFGEMSCMHGSPRSATIVAERPLYALEMLRNIIDGVISDRNYQEEADRVYKQRVLQAHLRRLSIFAELSDEEFRGVPEQVELLRLKVGEVILDEHDRPDCMYIVRGGLVKTVRGDSPLVAVGDVLDWPALCRALAPGEQEQAGPLGPVWQALSEPARAAAKGGAPSESERQEIAYGLSTFVKAPPLPDPKVKRAWPAGAEVEALLARLPKDGKQWPALDCRQFGRAWLEAALGPALRPWKARAGQGVVLAYQARGDFVGEMGLMTGLPRSATCVAYAHPDPGQGHGVKLPQAKWRREEPLVELVRVPKATFDLLVSRSPQVQKKLAAVVERRRREIEGMAHRPEWRAAGGRHSGRFEELGLVQGQRLMLIDLDRCTRCDECVKACVATHDDGRTRLFLDGPRFGKYLVPTTCRSCLDPVCMIGCPVDAIHRGSNRQMMIEDWCIGCGLCATNCPYGSIQMHDVGLVPEEAHGWRFYPAEGLSGDGWAQPGFNDRRWALGRAPFRYGAELKASLRALRLEYDGGPVCFRYELSVGAEVLAGARAFALAVTATEGEAKAWLNGKPVPLGAPKRGKREATLGKEAVRAGRNVLAVLATPTPRDNEELMKARLDEVADPDVPRGLEGEISEKLVSERAVVCDLCSGQWGQRPACVTACPHDAAMRVDARTEFPEG